MKRILTFILTIGLVLPFVSCEPEGGDSGKTEITNISVPKEANLGETITVRGEGFNADVAKLYFVDAENKETAVESPEFTSAGVKFVVPVTLTPGKYMLTVDQDGKVGLGEITLKFPDHNVAGLVVPEFGGSGLNMLVEGAGFAESASIILADAAGAETKLEIVDKDGGLNVALPATLAAGEYSVILEMNGLKWTVKEGFKVYKAKNLVSASIKSTMSQLIDMDGDEIPDGSMSMSSESTWSIARAVGKITSVTNKEVMTQEIKDNTGTVVDGGTQETDVVYTPTVTGSEYVFEAEEQPPFTLTVENSRVMSSSSVEFVYNPDIEDYDMVEQSLVWAYDAAGYLNTMSESGTAVKTLTYTDGNFVSYVDLENNVDFAYDSPAQAQNPYAIDMSQCIMGLSSYPAYHTVAVFYGLVGNTSTSLPKSSSMFGDAPFTYAKDADDYVTSVKWETPDGADIEMTLQYE